MKSFFVYFSYFFRIFQSRIKMRIKNNTKTIIPNIKISHTERLM